MASHLYWRLYVTATSSNDALQIRNLELYDLSGNFLCVGGTATQSAAYYDASYAFNQDPADFYSSGLVSGPWWIKYTFASPVDVGVMRLLPTEDYLPTAFKLQYSDDNSTWTDVLSVSGFTWTSPTRKSAAWLIGEATGGVAWRVKATADTPADGAAWMEVQFREAAGGSDITSPTNAGYFAFASAYSSSGYAPQYLFDNNEGTNWYSGGGNTNGAYIGWVFHRPVDVIQFALTSFSDGSYSFPAFDLQKSNDGGVTWTTVGSYTSSGWGNAETRVFDVASMETVQPVCMVIT